jgi:hypothetical protein
VEAAIITGACALIIGSFASIVNVCKGDPTLKFVFDVFLVACLLFVTMIESTEENGHPYILMISIVAYAGVRYFLPKGRSNA